MSGRLEDADLKLAPLLYRFRSFFPPQGRLLFLGGFKVKPKEDPKPGWGYPYFDTDSNGIFGWACFEVVDRPLLGKSKPIDLVGFCDFEKPCIYQVFLVFLVYGRSLLCRVQRPMVVALCCHARHAVSQALF